MKHRLFFATAAAVVLGCTACSSSRPSVTAPVVPRGKSTTATSAWSAGSASTSNFCDLARNIGKADLGVSTDSLDPEPKKLLSQVDQLNAIAPPELRKDFAAWLAASYLVCQRAVRAVSALPASVLA